MSTWDCNTASLAHNDIYLYDGWSKLSIVFNMRQVLYYLLRLCRQPEVSIKQERSYSMTTSYNTGSYYPKGADTGNYSYGSYSSDSSLNASQGYYSKSNSNFSEVRMIERLLYKFKYICIHICACLTIEWTHIHTVYFSLFE